MSVKRRFICFLYEKYPDITEDVIDAFLGLFMKKWMRKSYMAIHSLEKIQNKIKNKKMNSVELRFFIFLQGTN